MSGNTLSGNQAAKWLRWIARLAGVLMTASWVFSGIASAAVGPHEPWTIESTMMVIFIVTLTAGVILGWWRAGVGSTILLVCGVAFCIFAYFSAGHHKGFAMLVSGVPVLVCGLLFLASWRWSAKR